MHQFFEVSSHEVNREDNNLQQGTSAADKIASKYSPANEIIRG
jgi:hypothetical protein